MKNFIAQSLSFRAIMRGTRWFVFTAFLAGLAWGLYQFLPLEPRWSLPLEEIDFGVADFWWESGERVHVAGRGRSFRVLFAEGKTFLSTIGKAGDRGPFVTPGPLVLDVQSGKVLTRFPNHDGRPDALVHSPNGRHAVRLSGGELFCDWHQRAHLLDFATGAEQLLDLNGWQAMNALFAPHGRYFAVRLRGEEVDGERQFESYQVFDASTQASIFDTKSYSFAFLGGGKFVYYSDCICIYDLEEKRALARFPGTTPFMKLSPDSSRLATYVPDDEGITVWDIADPAQPRRLFRDGAVPTKEGAFTPDSRFWAIHGETGLQIWDTKAGAKRGEWPIRGLPVLNAGLRRVLMGDWRVETARLCDLETGKEIWSGAYTLFSPSSHAPRITRDLRHLIFNRGNGSSQIVDVESGGALGQYQAPPGWFGFYKDGAMAPQLTPDERYLLILDGESAQEESNFWLTKWLAGILPKKKDRAVSPMSVVDMRTLEIIYHLPDRPATSASLSPDGRTLLVMETDEEARCTLTCWDVGGGRQWRWILGVPGGIGVGVMVWRWLWRKRLEVP